MKNTNSIEDKSCKPFIQRTCCEQNETLPVLLKSLKNLSVADMKEHDLERTPCKLVSLASPRTHHETIIQEFLTSLQEPSAVDMDECEIERGFIQDLRAVDVTDPDLLSILETLRRKKPAS